MQAVSSIEDTVFYFSERIWGGEYEKKTFIGRGDFLDDLILCDWFDRVRFFRSQTSNAAC